MHRDAICFYNRPIANDKPPIMQLHGSPYLRGFGEPDFICRRFAVVTVRRQNRLQILCRGIRAGKDDIAGLSQLFPRIILIPIVQMKG